MSAVVVVVVDVVVLAVVEAIVTVVVVVAVVVVVNFGSNFGRDTHTEILVSLLYSSKILYSSTFLTVHFMYYGPQRSGQRCEPQIYFPRRKK